MVILCLELYVLKLLFAITAVIKIINEHILILHKRQLKMVSILIHEVLFYSIYAMVEPSGSSMA